jgi:hypothetical protein
MPQQSGRGGSRFGLPIRGGVISLLRDQPGSGSHVAIWSAGRRLGTFSVPAITGNETLSFLGVDFGSAIVSRVRITSGNLALGPGNNESGSQDLVVMDDSSTPSRSPFQSRPAPYCSALPCLDLDCSAADASEGAHYDLCGRLGSIPWARAEQHGCWPPSETRPETRSQISRENTDQYAATPAVG